MIWTEREPSYLPMGSEATRDYQRRWVIAMLGRRAEFARMEAEAWRARVVILDLERGQISQQIAESEAAVRFAHEEFRLAPVTIRFRRYYEAQIAPEAPVVWDELPAVKRLFPAADGRDR